VFKWPVRSFLLAMGVLVALAMPAGALAAPAADRPNVLLLMTDDQTAASMAQMPRTQQLLGAAGTTFENSFVTFSLCCPSRATALTGQYTHNHKVSGLAPPLGGYVKMDTSEWLPLWLQDAGYRTIHLGKFLNGYGVQNPNLTEVPPGFDVWQASLDPSTYDYMTFTLNENGSLRTHRGYQTDFYGDRAAELIEAESRHDGPFFMQVAFVAPHHGRNVEPDDPADLATPMVAPRHRDAYATTPLPLPPSFNELDVTDKPGRIAARMPLDPVKVAEVEEAYQQRLESLMAVDEAVERIVRALERTGELDRTLILFTSDNGFLHGEHRIGFGKVWPYEESIRVPLVMRGPGVPSGQVRRQLVMNTDLSPTILDAADAFALKPQDGRSLFPLLRDSKLDWGRDVLLYGRGNGVHFYGLRTPRYTYVRYTNGVEELYDLEADPYQLENQAGSPRYGPLRLELFRRLRALRHCRGDACAAGPRVQLETAPPPKRCVDGAVRLRLLGKDRSQVAAAAFYIGRRRVGRLRGRSTARRLGVERRVRTGMVRPGRRFRLRVELMFRDERVLTIDRRLEACRQR
jgi:N-acetylglucosamine-6-sulfatase